MDISPEDSQKFAMPKAARKSLKAPSDYSQNVHKFYAPVEEVEAAKQLASLNKRERRKHTNLSALVANELRKMIRLNAARLRKAGVKLPESIFAK